jgi:hypothetical protein
MRWALLVVINFAFAARGDGHLIQKSQHAKRFGGVNRYGVRHLTKLGHCRAPGKVAISVKIK